MPHTYIYSMLHVGNVSHRTANVQRDIVQTRKGERSFCAGQSCGRTNLQYDVPAFCVLGMLVVVVLLCGFRCRASQRGHQMVLR
jgi:hypothetical protein